MAKAVAKTKKTAAKSKSSAPARAKAAPPASARKALQKSPVKPAPKPPGKPVASKPAADAVKSGKWVFTFGDGKAEGKAGLRDLLGGKGANLAEMANLGLPVPPGFTIPTSVCTYFYAHDKSYPKELKAQVEHRAQSRSQRQDGRSAGGDVRRSPLRL
jgi:pyruvate,orthophosphate dikinase